MFGAVDGASWMVELSSGLVGRCYDVVAVIAGGGGDIRVAMVPGPYHLEAPFAQRIDLLTYRLDHRLVGGSQFIDDLYRGYENGRRNRRPGEPNLPG